ncbi:hypothetical protein CPB84DRAFT_1752312 [Gymnopilus junonius]|uniref:Uncharacterized protein n=1 Tax=Gymnopilus junonius TaxID=109634 RepID=A0A9P5TG67_GYMJU|nr:hypothetical protein CPB84DRAFT_1752312 [Gymnopilus junonius]
MRIDHLQLEVDVQAICFPLLDHYNGVRTELLEFSRLLLSSSHVPVRLVQLLVLGTTVNDISGDFRGVIDIEVTDSNFILPETTRLPTEEKLGGKGAPSLHVDNSSSVILCSQRPRFVPEAALEKERGEGRTQLGRIWAQGKKQSSVSDSKKNCDWDLTCNGGSEEFEEFEAYHGTHYVLMYPIPPVMIVERVLDLSQPLRIPQLPAGPDGNWEWVTRFRTRIPVTLGLEFRAGSEHNPASFSLKAGELKTNGLSSSKPLYNAGDFSQGALGNTMWKPTPRNTRRNHEIWRSHLYPSCPKYLTLVDRSPALAEDEV